MHAGYPIMMHMDMPAVITNRDTLMNKAHGGVWGLWHELGHNHQQGDWTFNGTGEVTCNLFTLHVLDRICGTKPMETPEIKGTLPRVEEHLAKGAPFDAWRRDPFLALCMYAQVQDAFGWELYRKVFAEYRDLPPTERPKSDQEKRDQWLLRLSRAADRNLGPFFETWGVPTSQAARDSLSVFDTWLPPDF
jgi:hypothetical protein